MFFSIRDTPPKKTGKEEEEEKKEEGLVSFSVSGDIKQPSPSKVCSFSNDYH